MLATDCNIYNLKTNMLNFWNENTFNALKITTNGE